MRELSRTDIQGDERGVIGIGTLIVFIAMIMVAAIAAGVLIRTSGRLQEQARSTGSETIYRVSSGVKVMAIKGRVEGNENIENVEIVTKLRAGSRPVDLSKLTIQYISENVEKHLTIGESENWMGTDTTHVMAYENRERFYADLATPPITDWYDGEHFAVVAVQPDDDPDPVHIRSMEEVVEIWINTDAVEAPGALSTGEQAGFRLMPSVGFEAYAKAVVPYSLERLEVTEL